MSNNCAIKLPEQRSDLPARIENGDRDAEHEFVVTYGDGIRILMRRHCRPFDSSVDDLVQEVLASLLQRLRMGAIRDPAALPAYIQSAVARTAAAAYRKRRPEAAAAELDDIPDPSNPPAALYREQLAEILRDVLQTMPVLRDRLVLRHLYLEERSKEEICLALGIDPQHFHRVVFRARERFRELLERKGMILAL